MFSPKPILNERPTNIELPSHSKFTAFISPQPPDPWPHLRQPRLPMTPARYYPSLPLLSLTPSPSLQCTRTFSESQFQVRSTDVLRKDYSLSCKTWYPEVSKCESETWFQLVLQLSYCVCARTERYTPYMTPVSIQGSSRFVPCYAPFTFAFYLTFFLRFSRVL